MNKCYEKNHTVTRGTRNFSRGWKLSCVFAFPAKENRLLCIIPFEMSVIEHMEKFAQNHHKHQRIRVFFQLATLNEDIIFSPKHGCFKIFAKKHMQGGINLPYYAASFRKKESSILVIIY